MSETRLLWGRKDIAEYLGKSEYAVGKWIKRHALPVCRAPNGMLLTSTGLIDEWLLARRSVQRYGHYTEEEIKRQPPEFWEAYNKERKEASINKKSRDKRVKKRLSKRGPRKN